MSEPIIEDDAQEFTTAIIAAVPAADDPVNDLVDGDAHITMFFLGEADDLSTDQVEAIKGYLGTLGDGLTAFPVEISGTAILGDDQANVLLVESDVLAKIREVLQSTPEITAALALSADQQYPTWVPHLTLAYPDDDGLSTPVQDSPVDTVVIGALALWLGGDKYEFPLQPFAFSTDDDSDYGDDDDAGWGDEDTEVVVTAAAGFDESLHPRGADGKFIEKFSVVKFLEHGLWDYGKVTGISKDTAGQVQINVTPSNLMGKPTGAPDKDLLPSQIYHAPQAKASLTITAPGTKKLGGQGGSNPGGLYEIPKPGSTVKQGGVIEGGADKFYVKTPQTAAHGKNEALANHLYEEAGVAVPEVHLGADGKLYSKIVPGQQDMASQLNNPEWADQVRRNFAVDAWLGNRDVFGMTYDNILTGPDGTPYRIDNGGALLYRAQGAKKTDFGSQVTELEAFRTGKKAKIFGAGMSKDQELDGAQRVLAITPDRIKEMVSDAGMPKSLADTLIARRAYLADYYGLPLPETQSAPGAQPGSTAPLVDAADLAVSGGKPRAWFGAKMHQLPMLLQTGDRVSFPDGSEQTYGVNDDGTLKTIVGQQAQLLSWTQTHGADASVMLMKPDKGIPRPAHEAHLSGSDLSGQQWERGDKLLGPDGVEYRVLGANSNTGAVLVQHNDDPVRLLDTYGADSTGTWQVSRWDPPAKPVLDAQDDHLTTVTMNPVKPNTGDQLAAVDTAVAAKPTAYAIPEPPAKVGQAAVAEEKIKADLNTPLPTGNGAPAPTKTSAQGVTGEKKMLIGDGTEAKPGDAVTSNKDGKTYTFVKPKGQYAVVTDPNGEDPKKQLLKLASTMAQPGKAPAADPNAIEKPKAATGEVPALGMMAQAKDGWAGEITMISPDGKFVFITDANGTRKRKSTGTVSITAKPTPVAETPKVVPGPIKGYGAKPTEKWAGEEKLSGWDKAPIPGEMVHVGYADGTHGLEPYDGQPVESLQTNSNGEIALYGGLKGYLGPVATNQLAFGSDKQTTYQVIWGGTIGYTDGTTGPNGGLVLWGHNSESGAPAHDYAWELPSQGQIVTVIGSESATSVPLTLPEGTGFQANDGDLGLPSPAPLYGEEAKTLGQLKGQLSVGQEISLDGQNWMTVTLAMPAGSVQVTDSNGDETFLNAWSNATYVVQAPPLVDGEKTLPDAPQDAPELPGQPPAGFKNASDLKPGDYVTLNNGTSGIIAESVPAHWSANDHQVTLMGDGTIFTFALGASQHIQTSGNAHDAPVDMAVQDAVEHLKPGATIKTGPSKTLTTVGWPIGDGAGGYKVGAMVNGDPNDLIMVESSDFGMHTTLPVQIPAAPTTDLGVDPVKLQELYDKGYVIQVQPTDHKWAMADQGIDYGNAGYPIFATTSGGYYRNGPTGTEGWNAALEEWQSVAGDTTGMEKVWDGVPAESVESKLDPSKPPLMFPGSAGYVPQPGELVQHATWASQPGGAQSFLVVYPDGNADSKGYMVTESGKLSTEPFQGASWKDAFADFTTIHDPFNGPDNGPQLTHQDGPAPQALAEAFAAKNGYTPEPGATYMAVTQLSTGKVYPFKKNDDGTWSSIGSTGQLSGAKFTNEEQLSPVNGFGNPEYSLYTWTAPGAAEGALPPVQGMPDTYSPFVPAAGQSVLKVTLANGKASAFLQGQPGAGWHLMNPDGSVTESGSAVKADWAVQNILNNGSVAGGATYELLHDGSIPTGTPAAPQSFAGYTPKPGDLVVLDNQGNPIVQHAGESVWHPVKNGVPDASTSVPDHFVQNALQNGKGTQVWPPEAGSANSTDTPSFSNLVPQPGDKIIDYFGQLYVLHPGAGQWVGIDPEGDLNPSVTLALADVPDHLGPEHGNDFKQVWPPVDTAAPSAPETPVAGVFNGYTTEPGDSVVSLTGETSGITSTYVKKAGTDGWLEIKPDGTLGGTMSQAAIEFGFKADGVTAKELQGTLAGTGVPQPLTTGKYAGVAVPVTLAEGNWTVADGSQLSTYATSKVNGLELQPGESAYKVGTAGIFKRTSAGEWFYVYSANNELNLEHTSDAEMEKEYGADKIVKINVKAPSSAPTVQGYTGPTIAGWSEHGLPDPAGMGHLTDIEAGLANAKKGDWIFVLQKGQSNGIYVQLAEDHKPSDGVSIKVGQYAAVNDGVVASPITPAGAFPMPVGELNDNYLQGHGGVAVQAPSMPSGAPAVPVTPAAPSAPSKPSYPGAQLPSQEDINAWGGDLTKDGHIPTSGMYVSGKGPMNGKIVSVSKDKTKATVLTGDGKKTTRLISALKTDKAANYTAYVPQAAPKEVPAGMPLAVDTVHDAVTKTVKDGKFRAIVHGHAGVSHGEVVVTKATGPSGKAYSRVHLTLTPEQRANVVAMLSGAGEKGDWATSSKMSEAVSVGDNLPMRLSSTPNPDGSPRWKVDASIKPPTHEITKVEPQSDGVLLVTLKDKTTGELITSRFHPGKSVTVYNWDPNKPKAISKGVLSLNDEAKAQGWSFVTDGGISAVQGGASGTLYHEPGSAISKGAFQDGGYSWKTLRNVSADGTVVELVEPQGDSKDSTTGTVCISVPEGMDETHLNAAFAKLGIPYEPMTQDSAKDNVRGLLRTLLSLDTSDVDTAKGWSDEKLFSQAGGNLGIPDLGWTDVLVGVDETTGKVSYYWSERARTAIANKTSYNLIGRAATTANADAIVSTVKYGSANSVLKRTTGMIDTPTGKGTGASWSSDKSNHAGNGSYSSAFKSQKLPVSNPMATYKSVGMMVYSRPEAVLGRIADFRVANSDAFGMGQGSGSDHLKYALTMPSVRDFYVGGGLPTEAVGFIAVQSSSERLKAISQLKAEGVTEVNGRPIEELIITLDQAKNLKPDDLPPVTLPANARPILDLPTSFDTATPEAAA